MIEIEERNFMHVMLSQALLGEITPNFRGVGILFDESSYKIIFVLEKESELDRESIEDVIIDYDIFLGSDTKLYDFPMETDILISNDDFPLKPYPENLHMVYRRKE